MTWNALYYQAGYMQFSSTKVQARILKYFSTFLAYGFLTQDISWTTGLILKFLAKTIKMEIPIQKKKYGYPLNPVFEFIMRTIPDYKRYIIFFLLFGNILLAHGQQYNREKVCSPDTVLVRRDRIHLIKTLSDTSPYKALKCSRVSDYGWRLDLGISAYRYKNRTSDWLGNHPGPLLGLALAYKKFSLGWKIKPWTLNPGTELSFTNDTLTKKAKLNPNKLDFYAGYSIDLKYNISIEPYAGWTKNIFYVINNEELNKTFRIPNANGFITGMVINKYFRLKEFQFLSAFIHFGYAHTDFSKTHPHLDKGYVEYSLGIAYKCFYKRIFLERIQ